MLHTHFNNLKVWLKSKGMLDKYKVDKNDTSMCAAFGLATKAQHSDAASENQLIPPPPPGPIYTSFALIYKFCFNIQVLLFSYLIHNISER